MYNKNYKDFCRFRKEYYLEKISGYVLFHAEDKTRAEVSCKRCLRLFLQRDKKLYNETEVELYERLYPILEGEIWEEQPFCEKCLRKIDVQLKEVI